MYANKHALITGGSEGLGLAIAKQLVRRGARVTLVARTLSKLQAAEEAVLQSSQNNSNQQQGHVFCYSADVTKYKQVQTSAGVSDALGGRCEISRHYFMQVADAVQAAEAALGHVDILVCCAGAAELGECLMVLLQAHCGNTTSASQHNFCRPIHWLALLISCPPVTLLQSPSPYTH